MDKIKAKNREHLERCIKTAMESAAEGACVDLNHIDVSGIDNFAHLFHDALELGNDWRPWSKKKSLLVDVCGWDVSKGKMFQGMFEGFLFRGDISKWSMGGAEVLDRMFAGSDFNGDISDWDMRGVESAVGMFTESRFEGDLSKWRFEKLKVNLAMFLSASTVLLDRLDPESWWGWSEENLADGLGRSKEWANQFVRRKLELKMRKALVSEEGCVVKSGIRKQNAL
jgi:Mycoplasma protein of unknown function, DUF285